MHSHVRAAALAERNKFSMFEPIRMQRPNLPLLVIDKKLNKANLNHSNPAAQSNTVLESSTK